MAQFDVQFITTNNLFDAVFEADQAFNTSFDTVVRVYDVDPYRGNYTIIPQLTSQTFETRHKLMTDDLTVKEIPIVKTSNPQGGQTVLIG